MTDEQNINKINEDNPETETPATTLSDDERKTAAEALAGKQASPNVKSDDETESSDLAEKLKRARRAMAGPEKVAEWEREKQEQEIEAEKNRLKENLRILDK